MPYFDASSLTASSEYVAWVDVMGTQASMSRSIQATANFVFKMHIAALEAVSCNARIRLYPVMDGLYASSPDQAVFVEFLRSLLLAVAQTFVTTKDQRHKFLVRGGLAFGSVYHGAMLPTTSSAKLSAAPQYRDSILLGMPMVQAHLAERTAPPFGIAVDESARGFAPQGSEPFHTAWWHWKNENTAADWNALTPAMAEYFAWCRDRSQPLGYPADRIAAHKEMYAQLVAAAS